MSPLPLADRPDLVTRREDGELLLSRKATAWLLGITEDDMQAEWERQGKPAVFKLPKAWLRQGKEITARLGTEDVFQALELLAREREE